MRKGLWIPNFPVIELALITHWEKYGAKRGPTDSTAEPINETAAAFACCLRSLRKFF